MEPSTPPAGTPEAHLEVLLVVLAEAGGPPALRALLYVAGSGAFAPASRLDRLDGLNFGTATLVSLYRRCDPLRRAVVLQLAGLLAVNGARADGERAVWARVS